MTDQTNQQAQIDVASVFTAAQIEAVNALAAQKAVEIFNNAINQLFNSDQFRNACAGASLRVLSDAAIGIAQQITGSFNVERFLTKPKQMSDGGCLALVAERLRSDNAMQLLVNRLPGGGRRYDIFSIADGNLLNSGFSTFSNDEAINEIDRQIDVLEQNIIANGGEVPTGPNIFCLVSVNQPIPNYEYFVEPETSADSQAGNEPDAVEEALPEQAIAADAAVSDVAPVTDDAAADASEQAVAEEVPTAEQPAQ